MSRSPQEVFSDHLAALAKRAVPMILEDYADDARILTPQGALEGLAGVEAFYTQALVGPSGSGGHHHIKGFRGRCAVGSLDRSGNCWHGR